jgi:hypothetical protein
MQGYSSSTLRITAGNCKQKKMNVVVSETVINSITTTTLVMMESANRNIIESNDIESVHDDHDINSYDDDDDDDDMNGVPSFPKSSFERLPFHDANQWEFVHTLEVQLFNCI